MMSLAPLLLAVWACAPTAVPDTPAAQAAPTQASEETPIAPRPGYRRIDGRTHPELIPDWRAWDTLFALSDAMGKRVDHPEDPRSRNFEDFVAGNLFISQADAAVLLEVAKRYRSRPPTTDADIERHAREHGEPAPAAVEAAGGSPWMHYYEHVANDARDEVLRRVSANGVKALERFIAARIKPFLVTEVRE